MSSKVQVVIIGGGLAGLSTAVYLLKESQNRIRVMLWEASPHLGGQAASWQRGGLPEEVGIHLDFPWYVNKLRLYDDVGQPLELVQTDGNYYICNGPAGRIDRLYAGVQTGTKGFYAGLTGVAKGLYGLWNFPGLTRRDVVWLLRWLYQLLRMPDSEIDQHDAPVDDFLRSRGASENLIAQLSLETVTIQGMRVHDASAASFMKFLKATYGCVAPLNPAFFTKPTGEALIEPLVKFIHEQGGEITTKRRAAAIQSDGSRLSVMGDGEFISADYMVLAMPGYLVPPLLPEAYRDQAPFAGLQRLTSATVITLTLWYEERWFPDHNVYISNREGVLFDAVADKARHWRECSHRGSIVQVLIDAAEDIAGWSDEQIRDAALADLERFFPSDRYPRSSPGEWHVLRHKNVYCETRPGYWSHVPREHETPINNLFLAGDYTAGLYHYGMESAVISGKQTANLIRAKHGLSTHPLVEVPFLSFVRR